MARSVLLRLASSVLAIPTMLLMALPVPARDEARPAPANETPTQLINRVLANAWKDNKVTPPKRTTDAEFARKLYADLLGRAPTADEIAALEKEKADDKREKLISRLLGDKAWAEHWAAIGTTALLPSDYNPVYKTQFQKWLAGRFAAGTSYAEIVKAMVSATGKTTENGAVHFILANIGTAIPEDKRGDAGQFDMAPVTSQTGRVFLGQGFQCLACHAHPFTAELRQRDFWGVNAFFRQAERVGDPAVANVLELKDNPKLNTDGIVRFNRRTGFMDATGLNFLNGRGPHGEDERPRRAMLADFIVRHKTFAPVAVNRTWTTLLGRGMLENAGMDELCDFNEPLYPELLTGLAIAFQEQGYDQKKLIGWICNSDVYQLNATTAVEDDKNFFQVKTPQIVGFKNAIESCAPGAKLGVVPGK